MSGFSDMDLEDLRVGLVLGAGGPVGHAFHAGVLRGIEHATGWDVRRSELVVGTSAGAQVGALIRGGLSGHDLAARVEKRPLSPTAQEVARHFIARQDLPKAETGGGRWPAAPGYVGRTIRRFWQMRPGRIVSALLPEGRASAMPQAHALRNVFSDEWPDDDLWITAVELDTGRAVAFGRPGDPVTDVGTAVVSSGAVPAIVAPVVIDGQRYVDGGVASPLHLDMLVPLELDLVIVSSPLCRIPPMRWVLRREAARLKRSGTQVLALQPNRIIADAMGWNLMDIARGPDVSKAAFRETIRLISGTPEPLAIEAT